MNTTTKSILAILAISIAVIVVLTIASTGKAKLATPTRPTTATQPAATQPAVNVATLTAAERIELIERREAVKAETKHRQLVSQYKRAIKQNIKAQRAKRVATAIIVSH